jgi:dephospho-CoA kinase
MVRIAVTGGIACGKSQVGRILESVGVAVCETDAVAHTLMRRGEPAYGEIVAAFGAGVLATGGEIDRARLGALVFASDAERGRLNAILHPRVAAAWRAWLRGLPADRRAAAVIVPLLYEVGADGGWDATICVYSSPAVQRQRLRERGLTGEEGRRRMAAQMAVEEKAERAEFVIVNSGTEETLREQTLRILDRILER